ncbi:MAG: serine protease [Candidatus Omnitrophica bacterium]|nr:serine protease [Candidatus Omnitrophota bacterium]
MSALNGVKGDALDLIIHSPGGTAEATEQIVNYLHRKFSEIRVIVPHSAMSAATMLACAASRIVMGKHSALGPIDPQIILPFSGGVRAVPAQSILDEFEEAQTTINNPANNPLMWVKRIGDYPPGILADCRKVSELSRTLVRGWLEDRMFAGDPEGGGKAKDLADWLGNNKNFLSHGRAIGIELARKQGFLVDALEDNQKLQEAVLTTFHATAATFRTTNCAKLVENHFGRGLYTRIHVQRA